MNPITTPIITGIITTYGGYYVLKYAMECFASAFFNKSAEVVTTSIKSAVSYARGSSPKEIPILDFEYEDVNILRDDEIKYVTSKRRKDSLNENWSEFDTNEILEIQNKKVAEKLCTPIYGPLKSKKSDVEPFLML